MLNTPADFPFPGSTAYWATERGKVEPCRILRRNPASGDAGPSALVQLTGPCAERYAASGNTTVPQARLHETFEAATGAALLARAKTAKRRRKAA